jgi:hypothetical protein
MRVSYQVILCLSGFCLDYDVLVNTAI